MYVFIYMYSCPILLSKTFLVKPNWYQLYENTYQIQSNTYVKN